VQPPDPERVAVVSQTTLSPEMADGIRDVLRARFPKLRQSASEDVCYATRNRQQAVRTLAAQVELVLVLGSSNSSNTRRLVETVQHAGGQARLITDLPDLAAVPLEQYATLGITSGASTPESFFKEILASLAARGFTTVEHLHAIIEQKLNFSLPILPDGE